MAAQYPSAVKSFSARNPGDVIQPSHVGDLQDEVNAMEAGLLQGTAPLNSSNSTVALLTVTGVFTAGAAVNGAVITLTDGATPALNAALGNIFLLTAAGNRTIAVPSNAVSGQKILIVHKASGADRTLALNSGAGGFRFGTDVTALSATTSAKTDYIGCIYNAAATFWDVVAVMKGF